MDTLSLTQELLPLFPVSVHDEIYHTPQFLHPFAGSNHTQLHHCGAHAAESDFLRER